MYAQGMTVREIQRFRKIFAALRLKFATRSGDRERILVRANGPQLSRFCSRHMAKDQIKLTLS
jgi:hypothetical protein